jgi:hypothetical protein
MRDTAQKVLKYIRGCWSIANHPHWMQDKSRSGRRVPGEDGERGVVQAKEREDMEKTRVSAKRRILKSAAPPVPGTWKVGPCSLEMEL